MSLLVPQRRHAESTVVGPLIPGRPGSAFGAVHVTAESANRHSAVWAAKRLRANLISSLPCDVFRRDPVTKVQIEMTKPIVLVEPGGPRWRYRQWMWATQWDLDGSGNVIGIITEKNALNLPSRIDLQLVSKCAVIQRKSKPLKYRIDGTVYDEADVWHERLYSVPGLEVGLSPLAYASWSIGEYLSIQDFVLAWFGGGAVPKARLKNTQKVVSAKEAAIVKERWKASVQAGDLFVHGSDWEYELMQAESFGSEWLQHRQYGNTDIARFFDVPADLIDAAVSGSSVTYVNIVERHLQLLVMHLGPVVGFREDALSTLLPRPRYVKLNGDALLRMDPATRAKILGLRLQTKQITPSEARELENLPPFTEAQILEIERLYGVARAATEPAKQTSAAPVVAPGRAPIRAEASVGRLPVLELEW